MTAGASLGSTSALSGFPITCSNCQCAHLLVMLSVGLCASWIHHPVHSPTNFAHSCCSFSVCMDALLGLQIRCYSPFLISGWFSYLYSGVFFTFSCRSVADSNKGSEGSSFDISMEDIELEEIRPMDPTRVPKEGFEWTTKGFHQAAMSRQFYQIRDSPSPYFRSRVQYRLFRGGIDIRPMHIAQQWVHFEFLEDLPQVVGLMNRLLGFGWKWTLVFNRIRMRQWFDNSTPH